MVLTDTAFEYFLLAQSKVRSSCAQSPLGHAFAYDGEDFFNRYETLRLCWSARESRRDTCRQSAIGRATFKQWEQLFIEYGTVGLLTPPPMISCDPGLEQLALLVKEARLHEHANYTLRLAEALKLPGATLELVRRIQRSHGFGQRQDTNDRQFYQLLQLIFESLDYAKKKIHSHHGHDPRNRAATFTDFTHDPFQQRVELFRALAQSTSSRCIRPSLMQFGIHPNRYYEMKERYMSYGAWLIYCTHLGLEKKFLRNWSLK